MKRLSGFRFAMTLTSCMAVSALAGSATAASVPNTQILEHSQPMVSITETAAGTQTQVAAYQSYVLSGAGIMTPALTEIDLSAAQANVLGLVPPISASGLPTSYSSDQSGADAVGGYFNRFEGAIATAAVGVMQALHAQPTGAIFDFVQEITVSGKKVKAVAGEWVNPNGTYRNLGVHVVDNRATALFAIYNEGAVVQGLPSSWTLPNPGTLTWAVADISINPATGAPTLTMKTIAGSVWHTQNYLHSGGLLGQYGEYDEPQSAKNTSGQPVDINCQQQPGSGICGGFAPGAIHNPNITFDPDVGLAAMIGNKTTPGPVYVLMQQYNATQAFVLYGRAVQPVYTPPSASGTQQAVVAVGIASRSADTNSFGCQDASGGATLFKNSGTIGWLLDYSFDEYLVQPTGTFQLLTNITQQKVSPTQSYSQQATVTVPSGQTPASYLGNDIVDPWGTGAVYSVYADTVHQLPASDYTPNPLPSISTSYQHFYTERILSTGQDLCIDQKNPSNVLINGAAESWSAWRGWVPGYSRRDGSQSWYGGVVYMTNAAPVGTLAVLFDGPVPGDRGERSIVYNPYTTSQRITSPNGNGLTWSVFPGWNYCAWDNGYTVNVCDHY
ncbi:MAG: hypothetical protein B7Z66_12300 [Chromatiales bacterium 21-64-14]|nr:MAG: hypothetical protein B7Z66_12300 [Chromatiales bacterium 21-64-14]HQU15501.1 hypothetical protein [Gammaproteobacteria bacterium]